MIITISPSKTLDYTSPLLMRSHTIPAFLTESTQLIECLRKKSPDEIAELMALSDKLTRLNVQRYQDFHTPFTPKNARPALLAFKGDVYEGIDVANYKEADFTFAQGHLRIISGLYGLLKPLDLIQPYRLEMGTRLKNPRGNDLYGFWGDKITQALNFTLREQNSQILVNLASQEYFKAVQPEKLNGKLLNIIFKEQQGDTLKTIGLFAKQARGKMTNFIIKNRIKTTQELTDFSEDGYKFNHDISNENNYVFTRSKNS